MCRAVPPRPGDKGRGRAPTEKTACQSRTRHARLSVISCRRLRSRPTHRCDIRPRSRSFLYSQYFYGGLRIAFGISLPAVLSLLVFHNAGSRLHDLGRRARGERGRHARPAQVQAQRNADLHGARHPVGARHGSREPVARDAVRDGGRAVVRALAHGRLRLSLAADQLRDAVHDDPHDGFGTQHRRGVRERGLDPARRTLVHVLEHGAQPAAARPRRAAGDRPRICSRLPPTCARGPRSTISTAISTRPTAPSCSARSRTHRQAGRRTRHRPAQSAEASRRAGSMRAAPCCSTCSSIRSTCTTAYSARIPTIR